MSDRQLIDDVKARSSLLQVLTELGARCEPGSQWDDETPVFCPFCDDKGSKKPAGRANELKGLYFCFSCGFGGDAIKIVMKSKDIDFDGALDYLDKKFPGEERENPWTT